jgi:cyclic pyranopterin phosphate synthase
MNMSERLTHLDDRGRARMVDVGDKPVTTREATARGRIRMAQETFARALSGDTPKGDIRAIAEIAGVMALRYRVSRSRLRPTRPSRPLS